jgi:hypothetical protein
MRVLFISGANGEDYQCDMLFHGLRQIEDVQVIDFNRLWYMYEHEFLSEENRKQDLYGKGFSLYGLLGRDDAVDREDIALKIKLLYFDFIIYGSIYRCGMMIDLVLYYYPPWRIIFIDGEDHSRIMYVLLGRGLYFKRELRTWRKNVQPIHFGFPAGNIAGRIDKTKIMAFSDPRDRNTYIYDTQEDYYRDYGNSLFAVTLRKSGWDCLRHYEIIANYCVPLFLDIEQCPAATLTWFPKFEIYQAVKQFESRGAKYFETEDGQSYWHCLMDGIHQVFVERATTVALAQSVLNTARQIGLGRSSSVMLPVVLPERLRDTWFTRRSQIGSRWRWYSRKMSKVLPGSGA